jgi:hypothetical protein
MYFFENTKNGRDCFSLVKYLESNGAKVLFNIGGNHILKGEMDSAQRDLIKLHYRFPDSYNCLVPPIHTTILEKLTNKPKGSIDAKVKKLNKIIEMIWNDKTIDMYSPFLDWDTHGPYLIALGDLVHFSQLADETVRIPLIVGTLSNA